MNKMTKAMLKHASFQAGEFIQLVPIGLPLVLQYNEDGNLEKIAYGLTGGTDATKELMLTIRDSSRLPISIPIKGGTTWVHGVLYTGARPNVPGNISEARFSEQYIEMFKQNPNNFNFFGYNVKSKSFNVTGAANIRQWLSMSKFNILPGFMAPANMTPELFDNLVTKLYNFKYPLISAFLSFGQTGCTIYPTDIHAHIVSGPIEDYIDRNGYVHKRVYVDENSLSVDELMCKSPEPLLFDYATIELNGIEDGDVIYLDSFHNLLYADTSRKPARQISYRCPKCGKVMNVTDDALRCGNPDCITRMYPDICHMLSVYKLPPLEYTDYIKLVDNGDITCLLDVLILPQYKDLKLSLTLSQVVDGLVPVESVHDRDIFNIIANNCSNNVMTFKHYISNPSEMVQDFQFKGKNMEVALNLFTPKLILYINTVIDSADIVQENKAFEGAPIFRGKEIVITGRFRHGNNNFIKSIFESYGAAVVTRVTESTGCVVVGDIPEDVSGIAIRKAKKARIDVFDESTFFNMYDIDADLNENM